MANSHDADFQLQLQKALEESKRLAKFQTEHRERALEEDEALQLERALRESLNDAKTQSATAGGFVQNNLSHFQTETDELKALEKALHESLSVSSETESQQPQKQCLGKKARNDMREEKKTDGSSDNQTPPLTNGRRRKPPARNNEAIMSLGGNKKTLIKSLAQYEEDMGWIQNFMDKTGCVNYDAARYYLEIGDELPDMYPRALPTNPFAHQERQKHKKLQAEHQWLAQFLYHTSIESNSRKPGEKEAQWYRSLSHQNLGLAVSWFRQESKNDCLPGSSTREKLRMAFHHRLIGLKFSLPSICLKDDSFAHIIGQCPSLCAEKYHCRALGEMYPLHILCHADFNEEDSPCDEKREWKVSLDIFELILSSFPRAVGESCGTGGKLPIHAACNQGAPPSFVRRLVEVSPKSLSVPSDEHGIPLFEACTGKSCLEVFKCLVDAFPNSVRVQDSSGKFALHLVCAKRPADLDIIRFLVEQWPEALQQYDKENQSTRHPMPIWIAPKKRLHQKFTSVNHEHHKNAWLPLHQACSAGAPLTTIRYLVDQSPQSIQVKSHLTEESPLFVAIRSTRNLKTLEAVEVLVSRQPNTIEARNKEGSLPLHVACSHRSDDFELIRYLVSLWPESVSEHKPALAFALQPKCGGVNLKTIRFLVSQCPQSVHDPWVLAAKNRTLHSSVREFLNWTSALLRSNCKKQIPSSQEELDLLLGRFGPDSGNSILDDEDVMHLRGMREALPSIQDTQRCIQTLSITLNEYGHSRDAADWRIQRCVDQEKLLSKRFDELVDRFDRLENPKKEVVSKRCVNLECTFFGNLQFGGMCSGCYMETPEGDRMRKERDKVRDAIHKNFHARREDHLIRNRRYTEKARSDTEAAIQKEVNAVSKLSSDEQKELGHRYSDPESIWSILEDRDSIVLLRASSLRKQKRLPKRPLAQSAIIGPDQLRRIYQRIESGLEGKSKPLPLIVISHCWRTPNHPDPKGRTLELIKQAFDDYWQLFGLEDMGIFVDWSCLHPFYYLAFMHSRTCAAPCISCTVQP